MDLWILNASFERLGIFDVATSTIWTSRYNKVGDFEICAAADAATVTLFRQGHYVIREDDDMVGVIEQIRINTSIDQGDTLIISGRSAESILDRRIVWQQTNLTGTVESGIRRLINEAAIAPTDQRRAIPGLVLAPAMGFTETFEMQTTGDNLLTKIIELCEAYDYGFKITLNENQQLVFSLYRGVNRSVGQTAMPYVVFSAEFDNLISSEYAADITNARNVALVAGEGEGLDRKTTEVVASGIPSGINRREVYVDARNLSTNNEEISSAQYTALMVEAGREALAAAQTITNFAGEAEITHTYKYKEDFNVGDVVEVVTKYGIAAHARIVEMIESEDETGRHYVPTFSDWEVDS